MGKLYCRRDEQIVEIQGKTHSRALKRNMAKRVEQILDLVGERRAEWQSWESRPSVKMEEPKVVEIQSVLVDSAQFRLIGRLMRNGLRLPSHVHLDLDRVPTKG